MGVDMAKQFGDGFHMFLGPKANSMAMTFFCFASLLVGLLSLFPIFIALRADGIVAWSWAVVFIPMWLIDACLGLFVVGRYFLWSPQQDVDDPEEEMLRADGTPMSSNERQQFRMERRAIGKMMDLVLGSKYLVQFVAWMTFQVLIVMKLDQSIEWPWSTVFIPWWIVEGVHAITLGTQYIYLVASKNSPLLSTDSLNGDAAGASLRLTLTQKILLAWTMYRSTLFRVLLAVLVVVRADQVILTSWAVVFVPVYVVYVWWLVEPVLQYYTLGKLMSGEQRSAFMTVFVLKEVALAVGGVVLFVMLGLLIARLDSSSSSSPPSVSVVSILIPVFVVLALVFCCCCCCLPCVTMVGSLAVDGDHDMEGSSSSNTTAAGFALALPAKRITAGDEVAVVPLTTTTTTDQQKKNRDEPSSSASHLS